MNFGNENNIAFYNYIAFSRQKGADSMAKGQKPKTEEEIIQKTAEYAARKLNQKRGNIKTHVSTEMNYSGTDTELTEMVQKAFILFGRPTATTDEQVCESFNWYFQEYLPKTGAFPTIEGLSLSCGVNRNALESWARGEYKSSPERSCIVQKAIAILAELDAQLVQNGKIPQVVYIFRSKNFYGMQDAVKVEHISQKETVQSAEELDRKYRDAVVVDYKPAEDDDSTAEQADSGSDSGAPDEPES